MKRALHFFIIKLRLSRPWKYKAPLLITVPYLVFLLSHDKGKESFQNILASVTIIVGVAGIGYLTNDLGDREKDRIINKENSTSGLALVEIALLFALFFALAIVPWFFLAFTSISMVLLCVQFSLFYLYSFRPIRLKERGFFGIIADALYAHTVPAILAAFTFYLVVDGSVVSFKTFLILLGVWQFLQGIKNICLHQLQDVDNDISSGTKTFVTQNGPYRVQNLVKYILLPLELVAFLFFIAFISYSFPELVLLILLYWIYKFVAEQKKTHSSGYKELSNIFLDDLYTQWLPFAVLILLCYRSFHFLPVLIFHFVVFRSELKTRLLYHWKQAFHR